MRRLYFLPVLLLILAVVFCAYRPGLTGSFVFDDNPNIVDNAYIAIQTLDASTLRSAAFSSTSGPLRRPVSMVSFALNYYYANGFNPYYFKATNLAIHLINGCGIFLLSCALLNAYRKKYEPELSQVSTMWVSLAVTAIWTLHPFNLTSVLYVVQRMNSLSAMFTIYGLALYTWGRVRLSKNTDGMIPVLTSLLIFTPLALLCKETGALLPCFALVIEITFFKFETASPIARRVLIGMYVITIAVPAIAALAYVGMHPIWLLDGYKGRDFTLCERVMTEARVLWFYLRQIVAPRISEMGLFHDDIINSHSLLSPVSTLYSLLGIVALLVTSFLARKRAPLITFCILFFLVGHVLESTVYPFEITFEHRNYLPMYGIIFTIVFYLLYPLKYADNLRARQVAAVLFIGVLAFGTFQRSLAWSSPIDFAYSEVTNHPQSARDNLEMGSIYERLGKINIENKKQYNFLAYQFLGRATALSPNYIGGLINSIMIEPENNAPVDPKLIDELKRRLEYSPASGNTGASLIKLISCVIDNQCRIPHTEIESLLHAALRNPTATGGTRSTILSAYSYYLIDVAKDYPAALDVMYQTVENNPGELEYRLSLVKFLGAWGHVDEARTQLAILSRLDDLHAYTAQIAAQEKKLAEAKMVHNLRQD